MTQRTNAHVDIVTDRTTGESGVAHFVNLTNGFAGLAASLLYLFCAFITVYEVVARYFFNEPTSWAFEIVMVICATAWMMSGGYVSLRHNHIAITIARDLSSPTIRWYLDLFGLLVGYAVIFILAEATLGPALHAIDLVERSGTGFNSPMPMVLKSMLFLGAFLYWLQLGANLMGHLGRPWLRAAVVIVTTLCLLRLIAVVIDGQGIMNQLVEVVFSPFTAVEYLRDAVEVRDLNVGVVTLGMVGALLLLMLSGMPLGVATLSVSIITAILFFGPRGLFLVSANAFGLLNNYPLVAVPLFVFMASILERAGIARDLFDAMSAFAGNLRGGVAVQTIVVAVILAAMTGVLGGEIVMLGLVALPQMLRLGYDRKLAIGTICAGGALATLIPPSIIIIVYGVAAQVSIGDLFLAGILPGLLLACLYIVYILVICWFKPSLAPLRPEFAPKANRRRFDRHQILALILAGLLIVVVMGSIYAGIASVTEASGVGVVGAMLIAIVRQKFNWNNIRASLVQTMETVGTIIWLVLGAVSLVGIYNVIGGNTFIQQVFASIGVAPILIVLLMVAVLLVLGTFMEWIAIVFITVPVFAPAVVEMAGGLGMDSRWVATWFGVIFVMTVQVSFLSPPFGPACFYLKSVAPKDVSLQEIFVAVLPFVGLQIVGIGLVLLFPDIALIIPKLMD